MKQISYPEAEVLKTAGSFIITSHMQPDGDAIGSVIGLGLALRDLDKNVAIVMEEPLPRAYRFLPGSELVLSAQQLQAHEMMQHLKHPALNFVKRGEHGATPNSFEETTATATGALKVMNPPSAGCAVDPAPLTCGITLDCTSLERVSKEVVEILDHCELLINIDHHISNTHFGALNVVDAEASATGEILYLLMSDLGIKISPDTATNLYTAIVTDTGSFQFQNTTSRCHLVTSMLLELSANHALVQQCLNEQKTLSSIHLLEKGLSTLTQDGQIAWMTLTRLSFEETGCRLEDSENFINYPKSVAGAEVGILFKEIDDHDVRVGFRSKSYADVNTLAGRFGGGGHKRAAGCTVRGTLPEAQSLVINATKAYLGEAQEAGCVKCEPPTSNLTPPISQK